MTKFGGALPILSTRRASLEILGPSDSELLRRYYTDNASHLEPWEPTRSDEYYSSVHWAAWTNASQQAARAGSDLKFAALNLEHTEVIGVCNFTNIALGAFQACNLGYSIAEKYLGRGLMGEIVAAAVDYMLNDYGLHRIMANYLPHNDRSKRLLQQLGFQREGYAESYLKITGRWQDHVLTAKIRDDLSCGQRLAAIE